MLWRCLMACNFKCTDFCLPILMSLIITGNLCWMAELYFIFSTISTSLSILRFYFFVCTTFRLSYLEYSIFLIADPSELESATLSDQETDTIILRGSKRNEQGLKAER